MKFVSKKKKKGKYLALSSYIRKNNELNNLPSDGKDQPVSRKLVRHSQPCIEQQPFFWKVMWIWSLVLLSLPVKSQTRYLESLFRFECWVVGFWEKSSQQLNQCKAWNNGIRGLMSSGTFRVFRGFQNLFVECKCSKTFLLFSKKNEWI